MTVDIIMPKVAMGQTEGQVVEWLIRETTHIEKRQPLMMIETEKVTQECESIGTGYLVKKPGWDEVVPCGTVIGWLAESKEEAKALREESKNMAAIPAVPPATKAEPVPERAAPQPQPVTAVPVAPSTNGQSKKIKISPVARRRAEEFNLNLAGIAGSGPGGRIIMKDVNEALERGAAVTSPTQAAWTGEVFDGLRVKASVPFQGMRKVIADHVVRSLATSAHLTIGAELDMTETIRLRKQLLKKEEEIGFRITYNDIFVLALAKAVQHVPIVNASLIEGEIKIWEDINVSMAVALDIGPYESGLITPVIRNADQKSLAEIGRETRELAGKAKNGTLGVDDLSGGTITLSNVGAIAPGWTVSTPIINQPQAFIVQPGAIVDRPTAVDGKVEIRPIMSVSVTFDHRIMDGVPPLKWLGKFKELVENPAYLHL